jgi:hypothetical protein
MTEPNQAPENGQVRVNLALQVAGIAAQVTAALRSGDDARRAQLERTLAGAQAQLDRGPAPEGLSLFIDVMRGLLRGEDVAADAQGLPESFSGVYHQVVDEMQHAQEEGPLTVRQVLDEVSHNVIVAMQQGSYAQRRMMANTLLQMERESAHRPDLALLVHFLQASRALLQDEDWAQPASQLTGPFQIRWEQILEALRQAGPPRSGETSEV